MVKQKILIVDDEEHILELIQYNLEANGYETFKAATIEAALEILNTHIIDGILLDVMLPDMDGFSALKKIRQMEHTQNIPVIMVTAKTDEIDKIVGLEIGADDYISKPFSIRELVARVHAVLRRHMRLESIVRETQILKLQDLELDITSHNVQCKGSIIELTLKEFELLKLLIQNKGKVMTRQILLDQVWGYDYYGETRTVDVHIRYLRAKLEPFGMENCIETVRGVGYKVAKES